jgi:hypothetical protein
MKDDIALLNLIVSMVVYTNLELKRIINIYTINSGLTKLIV